MKKLINGCKALLIIGLVIFVVNACLKDTYNDFSGVTPVVEFPDAIPGGSTAVTLQTGVDDTLTLRIDVTGANAPSHDLTIGLGNGGANGLVVYNQDTSHVTGTVLPDSAFTLPQTVVIKAGKDAYNNDNRTATFQVIFHANKFPITPGINYVLPIAITSVPSGNIISGNFGYILFNFYHNPWDGNYTANGTRYNYNAASEYTGWNNATDMPNATPDGVTAIGPGTTTLITVNSKYTLMHLAQDLLGTAFGYMRVQVHSDNTVSIASTCPDNDVSGDCSPPLSSLANIAPLPGKTCTYNPATKTFNMYYQYTNTSGTYRAIHEVLVHQ